MIYKRSFDDNWSFRNCDTKEYTHCYHNYPAMMIPQVARKLITEYRPKDGIRLLFDPYMGSGTSLVEANVAGIDAIGTDLNPLARLMSKVKTTRYEEEKIKSVFHNIQSSLVFYDPANVVDRDFSRISNYAFWYAEENLLKLSYISWLISQCDDEGCKDFFNLVLSEVVREVSFTRKGEFKRFRMPESTLRKFNPDAFRLFEMKAMRNIGGLRTFNETNSKARSTIYGFNTVEGIPSDIIPNDSVDMVVTSPPYGDSRTTVAYGQFSRWSNEWFGFEEARNLDNILMGGVKRNDEAFETESISPELEMIKSKDANRYMEVTSFLSDYCESIRNVARVVRSGGIVCYVVGNRTVKGVQIPLDYFTVEMFTRHGYRHIDTIVREIPNKRMPSKTSPTNKPGVKTGTMTNEYIVILEKEL